MMKNTQKQPTTRECLAFCLSLAVICLTYSLSHSVDFNSPEFSTCPELTHYEKGLVELHQKQPHHMELDPILHPQAQNIQCHIRIIKAKKRLDKASKNKKKQPSKEGVARENGGVKESEGKFPWNPFHPTDE